MSESRRDRAEGPGTALYVRAVHSQPWSVWPSLATLCALRPLDSGGRVTFTDLRRPRMKVLQTLGRHAGDQEGIFQYRRGPDGVHIDSAVGRASLTPAQITFTTDEWSRILRAIAAAQQSSFRLTARRGGSTNPPNQSLYELLSTAVPDPAGGWNWHDSWKACTCAILEHEGSVDLYHGALGPGHQAIICLSRDV